MRVCVLYWIVVPQNSCLPVTYECNLIWKSDLCRCNQIKTKSQWIRMDPNPMTGFPLRRGGFGHRDTRTNEGIPCKNRQILEWHSYKGHQGLWPCQSQEEARDEPAEEAAPCRHLIPDLWSSAPCENILLSFLNHMISDTLYDSPRKLVPRVSRGRNKVTSKQNKIK